MLRMTNPFPFSTQVLSDPHRRAIAHYSHGISLTIGFDSTDAIPIILITKHDRLDHAA
jgi:hypothetical protein